MPAWNIPAASEMAQKLLDFIAKEDPKAFDKIRFGSTSQGPMLGRKPWKVSVRRSAEVVSRCRFGHQTGFLSGYGALGAQRHWLCDSEHSNR